MLPSFLAACRAAADAHDAMLAKGLDATVVDGIRSWQSCNSLSRTAYTLIQEMAPHWESARDASPFVKANSVETFHDKASDAGAAFFTEFADRAFCFVDTFAIVVDTVRHAVDVMREETDGVLEAQRADPHKSKVRDKVFWQLLLFILLLLAVLIAKGYQLHKA
jgi:hypothetical protein|eukprot:gnl/Ergobibamus_cyprinoides/595.p2 GENE.gnl/Ergobibamus_cyprinoides/595~~gnl/Ergobibamus_cyprinoides/595.p2  ORF type:complete len:164 (+),score=49.89 gnl/Ergobibamus_cyprinoides/595:325-816(+)